MDERKRRVRLATNSFFTSFQFVSLSFPNNNNKKYAWEHGMLMSVLPLSSTSDKDTVLPDLAVPTSLSVDFGSGAANS